MSVTPPAIPVFWLATDSVVTPCTVAWLGPVWARERCRISPPRFLAECCKRRLNQGSFVLLYFRLFTFSDLYWVCLSVFSCSTVLFVVISQVIDCEDRLRNDLYCVEWGVKLYSNQLLRDWLRTQVTPMLVTPPAVPVFWLATDSVVTQCTVAWSAEDAATERCLATVDHVTYMCHVTDRCHRVVHGSILCDPTEPNPSTDWPNPTHYKWKKLDPTQYKQLNSTGTYGCRCLTPLSAHHYDLTHWLTLSLYYTLWSVSGTCQIGRKIKFNCLMQPNLI